MIQAPFKEIISENPKPYVKHNILTLLRVDLIVTVSLLEPPYIVTTPSLLINKFPRPQ